MHLVSLAICVKLLRACTQHKVLGLGSMFLCLNADAVAAAALDPFHSHLQNLLQEPTKPRTPR